jgi:ABC-2 type transport system permease protein
MISTIRKEFFRLFTLHRRVSALILFLPLVYTLLFGALFAEGNVQHVPFAVCSLDRGPYGRELARRFYEVQGLKTISAATEEETEMLLSTQKIQGALIIPPDFSSRIVKLQPSPVEVSVNLGNTAAGGTVMSSVQSIVASYNAETAVRNRAARGVPQEKAALETGEVTVSFRSLYNTTGMYNNFFLPVLIIHALQIALVFSIAPSFVYEKNRHLSYVKKNACTLIAAKALTYALLGCLSLMISLTAASFLFGMTLKAPLLPLLLLGFSFSLCMTTFALFTGSLVRIPVKCISYTLFYIMPSVLFSGGLWPRLSMDPVSLCLSYIMPIGYSADDLRDLLLRGNAPHLPLDLSILILLSFLFLTAAIVYMKRDEIHDLLHPCEKRNQHPCEKA